MPQSSVPGPGFDPLPPVIDEDDKMIVPRTRTEHFLGRIAGDPNAKALEPRTRRENFLAKIAGDPMSMKDIQPRTRREYFLNEIAENSGGSEPFGSISITANGTYDVKNYASAKVNVASNYGSLFNCTLTITNDYGGLINVRYIVLVVTDGNAKLEMQSAVIYGHTSKTIMAIRSLFCIELSPQSSSDKLVLSDATNFYYGIFKRSGELQNYVVGWTSNEGTASVTVNVE